MMDEKKIKDLVEDALSCLEAHMQGFRQASNTNVETAIERLEEIKSLIGGRPDTKMFCDCGQSEYWCTKKCPMPPIAEPRTAPANKEK